MNVTSRKEAIAAGKKRYFTGVPCKYGHIAERHVANSCCTECNLQNYRSWSESNPEKERIRNSRKRRVDPKYHKAWSLKNKDKQRERWRKYQLENSSKISKRRAARRRADPDKFRAIDKAKDAKRRSLKNKSNNHHTPRDIAAKLEAQHNLCVSCGACLVNGYHVDHIIPLSRGGGNEAENIQCLCPRCNLSKGSLTMEEWELRKKTQ